MGKLVFGMMQSLDGYDASATGGPQLPRPGEQLHRHFNDFRPFLLGGGKPYFSGPRPPLRLVSAESVGEDAVRLTYAILT